MDYKDNYGKYNRAQSSGANSESISGAESASPPPASTNLSKQQSLNIPNMNSKSDNPDKFLSRSLDIKKQLSSSFQGSSSHGISGGINKPQSRKNSTFAVKSNDGSEDDEDEYYYNGNNNSNNQSNSEGNLSRKKSGTSGSGNGSNANNNNSNSDDEDDSGHERKRRDNINDKIQELLTLVPTEFFQEQPTTNSASAQPNAQSGQSEHDAAIAAAMKNSGTKDGKPNKGQILTKSVEYIQYLQKVIDENNRKEVELIMKLKNLELKRDNNQSNVPINVGHTSAEVALGKIGVGPLSDDYFKQVLQNSSKRGSNMSP
ncbi:hypothetical protein CLIB1423_08S04258 [[Candida] railenensis]|uniref:BHLH domain-containing protein n=1 Tax=[Candida] railenensis TaxID=45579 RepID=A0A9P0QPA1_9ASCO|nr:hypothetical protein CLIB1423_08S04258 [[Candida] railenensis]